jgi:hypothetical protein
MIHPPRTKNSIPIKQKIIKHDDCVLALIDSIHSIESGLSFIGNRLDPLQIGKFRYNNGHVMRDHAHIDRPRTGERTQEILIVFKGSCQVRISDFDDKVIHVETLFPGEYVVYYAGGIGFTVLEDDTIMMEIKNGPYDVENDEQERRLI